MKTLIIAILVLLECHAANSQDSLKIKKGSYLFYGQPNIEDNSMYIEEAFNQERAIIQHISNLIVDKDGLQYVFTQEIPMPNEKNQLSIGIVYNALKTKPTGSQSHGGFGDLYINYRPMLMNKTDWALVIPRFTVIAPTGNAKYGFGSGGWGAQFNLAVTKRLNSKITTHWNAGSTRIFKEHFYAANTNGELQLARQKSHTSYNVGASAIYLVSNSFNFMLEYIAGFNRGFGELGQTQRVNETVINPGFRFAINAGITQIVPGLGIPLNFVDGKHVSTGTFVYLSIEPNYLAK